MLFGCLGCGGLAVILLVVLVGCGALLASDPDAGGTGSSGASQEEKAPEKGDEEAPAEDAAAEEEPAEEGPVVLEATAAEFVPSILADGEYTSVQVTVTNNGDEPIDINPLSFSITDDGGTKHDTADGLGMDENQIDTVTLAPGENATGAITAKGSFTPKSVAFEENMFMGDPITADVK
ncbi:DUF4352 domain-containing protein [Nocardiopsis sp. CNT-189]